MINTSEFSRRRAFFVLIAALAFPAACTISPDTHADAAVAPAAVSPAEAPPTGTVTEAPSNIRRFLPKDSSVAAEVAADKLDLRKVFEDLGPDATEWYQHVQTLSNPFFEGRAPGTRGGEVAAEYIEWYFRQCGVEPAFPSAGQEMGGGISKAGYTYRQPFDFASPNPDVRVLEAAGSMNGQPLTEGIDFVVLGNSGSGQVVGPVTFVGYGIEQGRDGYSSFDNDTDLTGRIALLLRYEPLDEQGKSKWSRARFSAASGIEMKMKSVVDRGAAAVILVNPPGAVDGKTTLETFRDSGRFGGRLTIPSVQVSQEVADRLLRAGDSQKRDLTSWRRLADNGEVKSVNLDNSLQVSLTSNLQVKDRLETENVAGVLRGKGSLADQWIVIGAHYDHLGYGYTGARPNNIGQLHPGADDNASGTAGVLIAAQRMARNYNEAADDANLRSVLFIAFSAEEAGLIGSKHFVEHPSMNVESINLMINMDMIGRLRSDNLLVQGTGTAENFDKLLKPIFESSGLKISASPTGRGPSDHSSFYGKDVPVLFLFTGEHADYHKPTDKGYTVNPAGAVKIIDLLEHLAMHFAAAPDRLKFAQATGGGPGRDTGAKVSLGTMPDYTAELETGMRVDGVRDGSSAAEGGIQAGDILLTWNGAEIAGARSLSEFLAKHEPGDKVKIMLRRGEEEKSVEVVLKGRAAQ